MIAYFAVGGLQRRHRANYRMTALVERPILKDGDGDRTHFCGRQVLSVRNMHMGRVDLKAEFKNLYTPPRTTPVIVDVPALNFLMVDGHGNPNTVQEYAEALAALYTVSYTLKFMVKKGPDAID